MQKKKILSEEETKNRDWAYKNLKKGMTVKGKVTSIQPYGVFIEIGNNVTGLLYMEDISIARIKHPKERFKIGQELSVIIKSFDKDTGKIIFTYKELLGNWEENIKDFKEKTTVKGTVRDREKSGIFIELKPNLVGMAEHKSGIIYGDNVNVYIKKISHDKKKIKLVILD